MSNKKTPETSAQNIQTNNYVQSTNHPRILPPFVASNTNNSDNQFTNLNLQAQQLAARQSIPRKLPEFYGNPTEWPIFYSSYTQSTQLCGYSNSENLLRLQESLKGKAKQLVQAQLNLPACVPDIMYTLKLIFGQPEYIIDEQLKQIRKIPSLNSEKLETVVTFSIAVSNLVTKFIQSDLKEHLNNPLLLRELIDRLPSNFKLDWLTQRSAIDLRQNLKTNVKHFSDWLKELSTRIYTVTKIYQGIEEPINYFDSVNKTDTENEKRNVRSENDETVKVKTCGVCKESRHDSLGDCKKFHILPIHKRWNCVTKFRLCRICLKVHRPYCLDTGDSCGINDCTKAHHKLLLLPIGDQPNSVGLVSKWPL